MYSLILRFDEQKGKTFTRFYEMVFKRRVNRLLLTIPKFEVFENLDFIESNYKDYNDETEFDGFTEFEMKVYNRYFIKNQRISFIAEDEGKNVKQIYNAIYRIKDKYKNNML